ncbi:MAG TPA: VWA domain-containing protein, partial [Candidatus Eremiobacteraeota bacterium]|nr:VWA domain-containing protein [Candidatus Eremiobacteraeota bacterium]
MNFIDFGAFSFLALVPVVILFYLLKLKRKPVIISNTFLWLQAFRDAKADRPFQNLTNNLLLILQILALIFLITVKARPYLKTSFQGGHHTVLIMDNSASMQATDTGKSRLAEAQKASLKIIDQMKSTDEMMIISVGSRPRIEITFTQNKGNLSKTIKSIKPLDSSTSVRDALILAISSLKNYSDGEIFLLSDGNFPDLGDLGPRIPVISFLNFGVNSNNVGITNINLRFSPFSSDFDLLVETENFSQEIKEFSLDIYLDNQLINAHKIRLERGKKKWEIFQNLSAPSGIITARINVKDDLLIDNSAYAVLSLPEPMKILLVSEGNPFLEHLFSITPRVEFSTIKPENYSINKIFDLIIFDGVNLKNIDKGNFIFIGTNVDLKGLRIIGEVKKPVIIAWDKLHPVMRFVELSDVS